MDSKSKYNAATRELVSDQTSLQTSFSDVLPASSGSQLSWTAIEHADSDFFYRLSSQDHSEIDAALKFFEELELYGDRVSRSTFPLPTLQHRLYQMSDRLNNGPGYILIRGLNFQKYSAEDITIIWLGIQSYIAETRLPQDEKNNMLVHLTCNTPTHLSQIASKHVRHNTETVQFHTDPTGDILAFLTRSSAAYGGRCLVASAYRIYDELAMNRPDVLEILSRPDWPFFLPYPHERPIVFVHDSKIIFNFNPLCLFGSLLHPRPKSLRPLSTSQLAALEVMQRLAHKYSRVLDTEAGDMHFINNLAVLHGREAFEDTEDQARHIVRMNLRNEEWAWELPAELLAQWFQPIEIFDQVWHVNPMPMDFSEHLLRRAL